MFRIVIVRRIYRLIFGVVLVDFNIVSLIRECLNNMLYNFNLLVCWYVRGKLFWYDGIMVFEFLFLVLFILFNVWKKGLIYWIKKFICDK